MSGSEVPDGAPGVGNGAGNDGTGSESLPSFLWNLGGSAKDLLKNPRVVILGIVIEWLVGGLVEFVANAIGIVLEAFGLASSVPVELVGVAIDLFGDMLEVAFLSPLRSMIGLLGSLAQSGGPVGALAAGIVVAVLIRVVAPFIPRLIGLVSPRLQRALELVAGLNPVRWFQ